MLMSIWQNQYNLKIPEYKKKFNKYQIQGFKWRLQLEQKNTQKSMFDVTHPSSNKKNEWLPK